MSTRSAIVRKVGPSEYVGVYCHFDGYPLSVGKTLLVHYSSDDKVAALLELGDLSCLRERIVPTDEHSYDRPERGVTVAYHRDRGEPLQITGGTTIAEVAEQIDHEFLYLWDGREWSCDGKPLSEMVEAGS